MGNLALRESAELVPNPENQEAIVVLKDLLTDALALNKRLPADRKLFTNRLDVVRDFLEQDFFSPETGIVRNSTRAATTRDWWGHGVGGPSMEFSVDRNGTPCITFRGNGVGVLGTEHRGEFEHEVIPGAHTVKVDSNGVLTTGGTPLSAEQVTEFAAAIRRVDEKVRRLLGY